MRACRALFQSGRGSRGPTPTRRRTRHFQTPGLFDVMKAHGGTKLAHMSDTALSDIVKGWGFTSKSLGMVEDGTLPLPELRKAISARYPAVEFDNRTEWVTGDAPDEVGQSPLQPTEQTAADTGEPDEADATLDDRIENLMSSGGRYPSSSIDGLDKPSKGGQAGNPISIRLLTGLTDLAQSKSRSPNEDICHGPKGGSAIMVALTHSHFPYN